jgi:hypothetical protein
MELDKQRALNERLENDLFQMDRHKVNGEDAASPGDFLAELNLGRKANVSRR